jgi:hypothetical protein
LFNGIRWNQFTRRLTAPTYIQTNLKEEANFTTWEVNAVGSPPGLSVDDLFDQQLEPARAAVGDTDARAEVVGFQAHIVFDKPTVNRQAWNGYLVSLYTLLNDYAALKDAANGNENFTSRLVGNNPQSGQAAISTSPWPLLLAS